MNSLTAFWADFQHGYVQICLVYYLACFLLHNVTPKVISVKNIQVGYILK